MTHWHYAQLAVRPADLLLTTTVGAEPNQTRDQAKASVQSILDRLAAVRSDAAALAETWRRGARDDTVYLGPFLWTLYECTTTCAASTQAMLDEFADIYRGLGVDVAVAAIPDTWR